MPPTSPLPPSGVASRLGPTSGDDAVRRSDAAAAPLPACMPSVMARLSSRRGEDTPAPALPRRKPALADAGPTAALSSEEPDAFRSSRAMGAPPPPPWWVWLRFRLVPGATGDATAAWAHFPPPTPGGPLRVLPPPSSWSAAVNGEPSVARGCENSSRGFRTALNCGSAAAVDAPPATRPGRSRPSRTHRTAARTVAIATRQANRVPRRSRGCLGSGAMRVLLRRRALRTALSPGRSCTAASPGGASSVSTDDSDPARSRSKKLRLEPYGCVAGLCGDAVSVNGAAPAAAAADVAMWPGGARRARVGVAATSTRPALSLRSPPGGPRLPSATGDMARVASGPRYRRWRRALLPALSCGLRGVVSSLPAGASLPDRERDDGDPNSAAAVWGRARPDCMRCRVVVDVGVSAGRASRDAPTPPRLLMGVDA